MDNTQILQKIERSGEGVTLELILKYTGRVDMLEVLKLPNVFMKIHFEKDKGLTDLKALTQGHINIEDIYNVLESYQDKGKWGIHKKLCYVVSVCNTTHYIKVMMFEYIDNNEKLAGSAYRAYPQMYRINAENNIYRDLYLRVYDYIYLGGTPEISSEELASLCKPKAHGFRKPLGDLLRYTRLHEPYRLKEYARHLYSEFSSSTNLNKMIWGTNYKSNPHYLAYT